MHMLAQSVGGSIVRSHMQPGTSRRRVVNTTLGPRYPWERPGTRWTEGCVKLGASLDSTRKLAYTVIRSSDRPALRESL